MHTLPGSLQAYRDRHLARSLEPMHNHRMRVATTGVGYWPLSRHEVPAESGPLHFR